jgi:hypothetical protein
MPISTPTTNTIASAFVGAQHVAPHLGTISTPTLTASACVLAFVVAQHAARFSANATAIHPSTPATFHGTLS